MDKEQIAHFNFRKHTVNGKFVVVFTQAAGYVIFVVAGSIFFAHYSNVMIGTINCRTHQVSCASVKTNVFFVGMFFMNCFSNKSTIGSQHKATQFCEDFYITHTRRNENFFVSLAHAFANGKDIVFRLVRFVSNTDTAGKIDELDVSTSFFLQLYCYLEKDTCQFRIVIVGNSVRSKECVHAKMFYAFSKKFFISFSHLRTSQTVFSITRVIHNVIGNSEMTTGIVTAADGFRNICYFFQKINVSNIVQVNGNI